MYKFRREELKQTKERIDLHYRSHVFLDRFGNLVERMNIERRSWQQVNFNMRNALQLVLEIFKCYYSVREKQEFTFTKLPNLTASFVQLKFFNVIYK